MWTDHTKVEYTNWRTSQPENWRDNEDCGDIHSYGKWNDIHCDHKYHFICRYNKGMRAVALSACNHSILGIVFH